MEFADFVIVGRGLMGTACARHLAEAGCDVALVGPDEPLDATSFSGPFGSFHDAGRITRGVADDAVWSRLATRSIARYRDLERRSGIAFYTDRGALMVGPDTGPMAGFTRDFLETAGRLGLRHDRLAPSELTARFAFFDLPSGSHAAFDPLGGVIDPRAMRQAEEALARAAGARVLASPVTARRGTVLSLASGAELEAGHIVLATGGWAGISGLCAPRPAMSVYLRTVLLAEITPEQAARLNAMPSLIYVPRDQATDLYVLPPIRYPDGRIYLKIGGESLSPQAQDEAALNAWFRTKGSAAAGAQLEGELRRLMPDLGIVRATTAACAVSFTQTGHPYIGRIEADTTLLTGGNGAAAKSADELGRLGAIAALGGDVAAEGLGSDFAPVLA